MSVPLVECDQGDRLSQYKCIEFRKSVVHCISRMPYPLQAGLKVKNIRHIMTEIYNLQEVVNELQRKLVMVTGFCNKLLYLKNDKF